MAREAWSGVKGEYTTKELCTANDSVPARLVASLLNENPEIFPLPKKIFSVGNTKAPVWFVLVHAVSLMLVGIHARRDHHSRLQPQEDA
jgi:hypothetical protein